MIDKSNEAHSEYLKAFGHITLNFAGLEHTITSSIANLFIGAQGASDLEKVNFNFHIAQIITAEMRFQKLVEFLMALHDSVEPDKQRHGDLAILMKKASEVEGRRNQIIHSAWFSPTIGSGEDFSLIRSKTTAKRKGLNTQLERVSLEELNDLADQIWDISVELRRFFMRVHPQEKPTGE